MNRSAILTGVAILLYSTSCASPDADSAPLPPVSVPQDYIIVAGEPVPYAGTVITFDEPGAYDAAQETCFFAPEQALPTRPAAGCDTPRRYGDRPTADLDSWVRTDVEARGWTRETLRARVSQFVLHYDVCATSRRCFRVLHDLRGLSVHFLLDVDGTLHQTLDLAARARHAGAANGRSVGIEIAHIGAYPAGDSTLDGFYRPDGRGGLVLALPETFEPPAPGVFRPARPGLFSGRINGQDLMMPDYTEAQYRSLETLIDFLCAEFPHLHRRVPRDSAGAVRADVLPPGELETYGGLLGHWHVTDRKTDPGPALDWERLLER